MLCSSALRAYEKYGVSTGADGSVHQRGILINYESLPGGVARILLPLFNIVPTTTWLSKMAYTSTHYSKSRGKAPKPFFGDSEDKDQRATDAIQKFSALILQPSYEKLAAKNLEAVKAINPDEYARMLATTDAPEEGKSVDKPNPAAATDVNWKALKEVPLLPMASRALANGENVQGETAAAGSASQPILRGKHSTFDNIQEYAPWAPFANTHTSKPFEVLTHTTRLVINNVMHFINAQFN
jgi:hypothetical protein